MKNVVLTSVLILIVCLMTQPMLFAGVADNLVAYWNFDEGKGDTAGDASGNGHDGVLMGDPQWTDGKFGGALEFDQEGDEVNVPYHENLNQEEAFTISAWANVEEGSDGHRAVVSCRDDFPPTRVYPLCRTPCWQYMAFYRRQRCWMGPYSGTRGGFR